MPTVGGTQSYHPDSRPSRLVHNSHFGYVFQYDQTRLPWLHHSIQPLADHLLRSWFAGFDMERSQDTSGLCAIVLSFTLGGPDGNAAPTAGLD